MNGFDLRSIEFRQFLVKAKLAGYATAGEGGERDSDDRGKEFRFSDIGLEYRDRYYGFNPFAGEEVVWHGRNPGWVMNYYGSVNSADPNPVEVFDFLKRAMQRVTVDRPFRGPERLTEGDLEYLDEGSGDIDRFKGTEVICYKGTPIYSLHYHGGAILESQRVD